MCSKQYVTQQFRDTVTLLSLRINGLQQVKIEVLLGYRIIGPLLTSGFLNWSSRWSKQLGRYTIRQQLLCYILSAQLLHRIAINEGEKYMAVYQYLVLLFGWPYCNVGDSIINKKQGLFLLGATLQKYRNLCLMK